MIGAVSRTVQAALVARPVTSIIFRESASYHLPEPATDLEARPTRNNTLESLREEPARPKPPLLSALKAQKDLKLPLSLQWGHQTRRDPRSTRKQEGAILIAFWSSTLFTLRYPLMSATIDLEPNTVVKAVKGPPLPMYSWRTKSPNARFVYTRDTDKANIELQMLQPGPLGFDMEWKPNTIVGQAPNPVALIQLANDELVILLQVSAMESAYWVYLSHNCRSGLPAL